jgi:hypothetical protein
MTRRVEDSNDLLNQLRNKTNEFESFCLALDESNNTRDTAQLLIGIRAVTESLEMVEGLASPLKFAWSSIQGKICFSVCVKP